jgi:hypothetical protein
VLGVSEAISLVLRLINAQRMRRLPDPKPFG